VTGTLAFVFIVLAVICVIAGATAVARTRRATREDADYGADDQATYAEEAAAVAAAEAAGAAAAQPAGADDEPEDLRP
jgi:Na+-transporting methylmalonyl-CoA/oxaloacetate decarboxylase gamma subunit